MKTTTKQVTKSEIYAAMFTGLVGAVVLYACYAPRDLLYILNHLI